MNVDVQARHGPNGEIVITSAWCPTCKQDAMPNMHGECSWCGTRIVDESTLKVGPNGLQSRKVDRRQGYWTEAVIIEAIRRWAAAHDGLPPTSKDWTVAQEHYPSMTVVKYRFGSWANAIEEAGFPRPQRGITAAQLRERGSSPVHGQAAGTPGPDGAGDDALSGDGASPVGGAAPSLVESGLRLLADARVFLDQLEYELKRHA